MRNFKLLSVTLLLGALTNPAHADFISQLKNLATAANRRSAQPVAVDVVARVRSSLTVSKPYASPPQSSTARIHGDFLFNEYRVSNSRTAPSLRAPRGELRTHF